MARTWMGPSLEPKISRSKRYFLQSQKRLRLQLCSWKSGETHCISIAILVHITVLTWTVSTSNLPQFIPSVRGVWSSREERLKVKSVYVTFSEHFSGFFCPGVVCKVNTVYKALLNLALPILNWGVIFLSFHILRSHGLFIASHTPQTLCLS